MPADESPALAVIARAAWESHEVLLRYRGDEVRVQPLGLVLKGDRWYLLARAPGRSSPERQLRLFRVSRVEAAERLDQHFERPPGFDLAREWARLRQAFVDSLPEYDVTVRIAPRAEQQLALLAEGRPKTLPLPADVVRDAQGWAAIRLRFETPERATRLLLQLGADLEVLDPPELRHRMAEAAAGLAALYSLR